MDTIQGLNCDRFLQLTFYDVCWIFGDPGSKHPDVAALLNSFEQDLHLEDQAREWLLHHAYDLWLMMRARRYEW